MTRLRRSGTALAGALLVLPPAASAPAQSPAPEPLPVVALRDVGADVAVVLQLPPWTDHPPALTFRVSDAAGRTVATSGRALVGPGGQLVVVPGAARGGQAQDAGAVRDATTRLLLRTGPSVRTTVVGAQPEQVLARAADGWAAALRVVRENGGAGSAATAAALAVPALDPAVRPAALAVQLSADPAPETVAPGALGQQLVEAGVVPYVVAPRGSGFWDAVTARAGGAVLREREALAGLLAQQYVVRVPGRVRGSQVAVRVGFGERVLATRIAVPAQARPAANVNSTPGASAAETTDGGGLPAATVAAAGLAALTAALAVLALARRRRSRARRPAHYAAQGRAAARVPVEHVPAHARTPRSR